MCYSVSSAEILVYLVRCFYLIEIYALCVGNRNDKYHFSFTSRTRVGVRWNFLRTLLLWEMEDLQLELPTRLAVGSFTSRARYKFYC